MKRSVILWVQLAIIIVAVVAWKGFGLIGGQNLLAFLTGWCFLNSVLLLSVAKPGDITSKPESRFTKTFFVFVDLFLVGSMAWDGHFVLAAMWLAASIFGFAAETIGRRPKGGQVQIVSGGAVGIQANGDVSITTQGGKA